MKQPCTDCGGPVPSSPEDLAPPELRCPSCAEVAAARARTKRTRTGLALIGSGLAALGVVVFMARAGVNPGEQPSMDGLDGDMGLVGILAFAGLSCLVLGLTYLPRLRRRLKT